MAKKAADHAAEVRRAIEEKREPDADARNWLWNGKTPPRGNHRDYLRKAWDDMAERHGVTRHLSHIEWQIEWAAEEPLRRERRRLGAINRMVQEEAKRLPDDITRRVKKDHLARLRQLLTAEKDSWSIAVGRQIVKSLRETLGNPEKPDVEPEPPEQPSAYRVQKQAEAWGVKLKPSRPRVARKRNDGWGSGLSLDDFKTEAQRWNDQLTPEMKDAGLGDKRRKD